MDVYEPRDDASLVHYTVGGPYFDDYRDCEYAKEWFEERAAALKCDQLRTLKKTDLR